MFYDVFENCVLKRELIQGALPMKWVSAAQQSLTGRKTAIALLVPPS